jgi:hypothetical protein
MSATKESVALLNFERYKATAAVFAFVSAPAPKDEQTGERTARVPLSAFLVQTFTTSW